MFWRKLEAAIRKELDAQHRLFSQRRGKQQRSASRIGAKLRNLNDALADGTMDREAYRETYLRLNCGYVLDSSSPNRLWFSEWRTTLARSGSSKRASRPSKRAAST